MGKKRNSVKQPLLILLSLFIVNIITIVTLFLLQETYANDVLCDFLPIILSIFVPFLVGYIFKSEFSKKDIIPLFIIGLITIGIAVLQYLNIYSTDVFIDIISSYCYVFNFGEAVILEFVTSRHYEGIIAERIVYSIVSIIYPLIVFASYYIGGSIKAKIKKIK